MCSSTKLRFHCGCSKGRIAQTLRNAVRSYLFLSWTSGLGRGVSQSHILSISPVSSPSFLLFFPPSPCLTTLFLLPAGLSCDWFIWQILSLPSVALEFRAKVWTLTMISAQGATKEHSRQDAHADAYVCRNSFKPFTPGTAGNVAGCEFGQ